MFNLIQTTEMTWDQSLILQKLEPHISARRIRPSPHTCCVLWGQTCPVARRYSLISYLWVCLETYFPSAAVAGLCISCSTNPVAPTSRRGHRFVYERKLSVAKKKKKKKQEFLYKAATTGPHYICLAPTEGAFTSITDQFPLSRGVTTYFFWRAPHTYFSGEPPSSQADTLLLWM